MFLSLFSRSAGWLVGSLEASRFVCLVVSVVAGSYSLATSLNSYEKNPLTQTTITARTKKKQQQQKTISRHTGDTQVKFMRQKQLTGQQSWLAFLCGTPFSLCSPLRQRNSPVLLPSMLICHCCQLCKKHSYVPKKRT